MSVEQLISQISEGVDAKETLHSILMDKIATRIEESKAEIMTELSDATVASAKQGRISAATHDQSGSPESVKANQKKIGFLAKMRQRAARAKADLE